MAELYKSLPATINRFDYLSPWLCENEIQNLSFYRSKSPMHTRIELLGISATKVKPDVNRSKQGTNKTFVPFSLSP